MIWVKMNLMRFRTLLLSFAIFILILIALNQLNDIGRYKYEILELRAIPHIELINASFEFEGTYIVNVRGFVKFDDSKKQPKNLRQYYVFGTETTDGNVRKFYVDEIIAMEYLPPRVFDREVLKIFGENDEGLVLVDSAGNKFGFNKKTGSVKITDATGDIARLLTSQLEYGKYVKGISY